MRMARKREGMAVRRNAHLMRMRRNFNRNRRNGNGHIDHVVVGKFMPMRDIMHMISDGVRVPVYRMPMAHAMRMR